MVNREQIASAIVWPDVDVRQLAMNYFSRALTADGSIMPRVITALESHGRAEAFHSIFNLRHLPQSPATIAWLIEELQRPSRRTTSEVLYYNDLAATLCHAELPLLTDRADEILHSPRLPDVFAEVLKGRLEVQGWDLEQCWQELETFCEERRWQDSLEPGALEHAAVLVEAMAEQPASPLLERVSRLLDQPADLAEEDGPWHIMELVMVELAGRARLTELVDPLLDRLSSDNPLLCDSVVEALVRLDDDRVMEQIGLRWPTADVSFQLGAAEVLERVRTPAALQLTVTQLTQCDDMEVACLLAGAALSHCCPVGVRAVMEILAESREMQLDPQLRMLLRASSQIADLSVATIGETTPAAIAS